MKHLFVGLAIFGGACLCSADVKGVWKGTVLMGPNTVAQKLDGDGLFKLQMSKAFLKSVVYEIQLNPDRTFLTKVTSPTIGVRRGKGIWDQFGSVVSLNMVEDAGVKVRRLMKGVLSSDGKRMVVTVENRADLPTTKIVFERPASSATSQKPTSVPKKAKN
jgi:hypothetical protein